MSHPVQADLLGHAMEDVPGPPPAGFLSHLKECAPCREEVVRARETHERLEAFYSDLPFQAPFGRNERILSKVATLRPLPPKRRRAIQRSRWPGLAGIAASLVACTLVWWSILAPLRPPPGSAPPDSEQSRTERVRSLIHTLDSGNVEAQHRAVRDLAAMGREVVPFLDLSLAEHRGPLSLSLREVLGALPQEDVAARIDGAVITWKEVTMSLRDLKPEDLTLDLKKAKLRELAEETLSFQAARRLGIVVSDLELDDAQRQDASRWGATEFERLLRIRWGTVEAYREDKRKVLTFYKVYQSASDPAQTDPELKALNLRPSVGPDEERSYYKAHSEVFRSIEQIAFIQIGFRCATDQEEALKRELAESLLRKVEQGSDFALLASTYSEIPRQRKFFMGGVSREDLQGSYSAETVHLLFDTLKEGELSPIIKEPKSLYLFRVLQKFSQTVQSFEQAQSRIHGVLENQAREESRAILLDYLARKAHIEPANLLRDK